jgi:hypothetical protein
VSERDTTRQGHSPIGRGAVGGSGWALNQPVWVMKPGAVGRGRRPEGADGNWAVRPRPTTCSTTWVCRRQLPSSERCSFGRWCGHPFYRVPDPRPGPSVRQAGLWPLLLARAVSPSWTRAAVCPQPVGGFVTSSGGGDATSRRAP